MLTFISFFSLILGAIVGSFILVVSLRYNTGKSLKGRSQCFSCGKKLSWHELVPLLSYISQQGKCKGCSSRIPKETFLVEASMGLVFLVISLRSFFAGYAIPFTSEYLLGTLLLMILFSILSIIFIYDLKHKIIPDSLSFLFGILSFFSMFYFGFNNGIYIFTGFSYPILIDVLAGVLVPLPFFLIWLLSKGNMMGLGDPKLMVGIGFLLGLAKGFTAVLVSFWLGTLIIISFLVIEKIVKIKLLGKAKEGIMKQEIPFGPFLVAGTLFTILSNISLF